MPYKDENVRKKKQQEYSRKNYEVNYEKRREQITARRKEFKKEWDEFKCTLKCTKCGFSHPAALEIGRAQV